MSFAGVWCQRPSNWIFGGIKLTDGKKRLNHHSPTLIYSKPTSKQFLFIYLACFKEKKLSKYEKCDVTLT